MFLTDKTFQEIIEGIVLTKNINYIDAIIKYCSDNELDPEDISKVVSDNLRSKIKLAAMAEGMIKKESQLPI